MSEPTTSDVEVDLLVVGAGPVGLYASYCAGFRDLSVAVVDSQEILGGQVAALYPSKPLYDVGGFPAVTGAELIAGLIKQADDANPTYLLGRTATEHAALPDGRVRITMDSGPAVVARAVVVTGGVGGFRPRPLPVADTWLGRGATYVVGDPVVYRGVRVVIAGGGDSACDWALSIAPLAARVTLVHRRGTFRAHEHSVRLLGESGVDVRTYTEVTAAYGDEALRSVELTDVKTGVSVRHETDALIPAFGFIANLGPLRNWGLELQGQCIVVDTDMRTSVPRIYAAGDITSYKGKVRLISVGFGEAATAVNNAVHNDISGEPTFPGHSSEKPRQ